MDILMRLEQLEEMFYDLESITWDEDEKKEFQDNCSELLAMLPDDDRQFTPRILEMMD